MKTLFFLAAAMLLLDVALFGTVHLRQAKVAITGELRSIQTYADHRMAEFVTGR